MKIGENSMSWIEDKDKRKIHEWVKNYKKSYSFPRIDSEKYSYFTRFDNNNNIVELDFQSLPQLQTALESMWKGSTLEEIVVPCAVAAFKRQPTKENITKGDELRIPDFVYAF
jgi:hypothetical protein